MLIRKFSRILPLLLLLTGIIACASVPTNEISYNPSAIQFDGENALATNAEFVQKFPNRDSGQPNNRLAIEYLQNEFRSLGMTCEIQEWEIINYNELVPLNNLACELTGESPQQIVIMAHHDQAPMTIEGADNDGSGISVLLELAKIFASEPTPKHSLVFLSTDAEEYGMIGTAHFVETHPNPDQIIAGFSIDNVGKYFYDGMDMSPIGQFRGYGSLWLQRLIRDSTAAADGVWVPQIRPPLAQIIDQAVPISFMDQGPMVAANIPAIGFAALVPPQFSEDHWESFHTPADLVELQSADALQQAGRITEAIVRQLLTMDTFPQESGPYIYYEDSEEVLRGPALYLIFTLFTLIFFAISFIVSEKPLAKTVAGWKQAALHYLGLWLPFLAGALLLYIFVAVGIMDNYHIYPATNKDPKLFEPIWLAVILFVLGLVIFFWLGQKLSARFSQQTPSFKARKSLAFLIIGLACTYTLLTNPFSLFVPLPVLFWILITNKQGARRILDIIYFLLAGILIYLGIYYFGWVVLRNNWAILWYVQMMISIQMASFTAVATVTAVIAAGLSMIVNPTHPRKQKQDEPTNEQLNTA